jgi:hypothetical protein
MLLICDYRVPEGYLHDIGRVLSPERVILFDAWMSALPYKTIRSHPDIYFFQISERELIHAPSVPIEILKCLKDFGVKLIEGLEDPGATYPFTSRYNFLRMGQYIIGNFKYSDPVIIDEIDERGLKKIEVNQGYARCSIMKLSENSALTTDDIICSKMLESGISALKVSAKTIKLKGEKQGFIGGASGYIGGMESFLIGDLDKLDGGEKVREFIRKNNHKVLELKGREILDIGTVFTFT